MTDQNKAPLVSTDPAAEKLDVLAVGAHPDDVEIGCGGTLAALVEQGYKVGIIDLTDGEPTPGSPSPAVRLKEAEAAAKTLGVRRVILDLPNRKLFDSYEARVKLAVQFRKYRPQLVLSLGDKTPLASPDHWQAMQITEGALFYSRLTKWDPEFEGYPPHTIPGLMHYLLQFHRLDIPTSAGNLVVDISRTLRTKLAAVRCYKTQFPPEKQHVFSRVENMARHIGPTAGFVAGEMLYSARSLGTKDLMKSLFG